MSSAKRNFRQSIAQHQSTMQGGYTSRSVISIRNAQRRVTCELEKFSAKSVSGQILAASAMNAFNSFDAPGTVVPHEFSDFTLGSKGLEVTLPPMSVVVIELAGTVELSPGIKLKNPKAGINYSYYEGRWDRLPSFDSLSPKRSDMIEQINHSIE